MLRIKCISILKLFINVKTIKLAEEQDGNNKDVDCFQMLLCVLAI